MAAATVCQLWGVPNKKWAGPAASACPRIHCCQGRGGRQSGVGAAVRQLLPDPSSWALSLRAKEG